MNQAKAARPGKRIYPPLPPALDAPLAELYTEATGRIAYYADEDGGGRPLLLVHSINAAPSSFELKPLFERFRAERPVYSMDLPGFGQSERGDYVYSPALYAKAIEAMLEQVIGTPADLLALSLSAEFAARASLSAPEKVASLVLVSPTGFSKRKVPGPGVGRVAHRVLSTPLWAQGLFDLVTSRQSVRYYLNKSFTATAPQELIDYAYATSHQPGARFAPLTFLSGQLFTQDAMTNLYARLTDVPVLAIADRDPYVSFERLPQFAASRPNWRHETLAPNMGLPHWEHPEATFELLEGFWRGD
ncbi:MAG: alpha/beta hydrolase [Thiohalocapsa sp.]|jgi:pimeloyl-ACP methyl ester carboxylesterase|uniref:alpha/beta fold hydrolase n=1 Tax=Thiohalocapsa sp. TaxID=2497641 RepID=UPI0025CF38E5|nr:alpha/beta hydrolase [Thiohalocapsa sp.]MCG6941830.1 alpha/beta hydrolase [Thiohalocapsa sp.]